MRKESKTIYSLPAMQASEIRYRRLFETAQDGILILNAETGEIEDVNPYMIDMLHYSREEFLGMKVWEVSPFKDKVLNQDAFAELQDKGYIRYKDLPLETKEGNPIAVEFVSNVYKANGNKVIQCNIRNITERKRDEAKLMQQAAAMDAATDGIALLNEEGEYAYVNNAHAKVYGYENAGELIGKSWRVLYDSDLLQCFDQEIMPEFSRKGNWHGEAMGMKKDGSKFPQELSLTAMADGGLICIVRDITERKKSEEALSNSEVRRRTLLQTIPDLIWLKDKDGVYLSCNRMFERFFGAREADIVGKTDYDFVDRELADAFLEHDRKAMAAGKPTSNEEWITFADDGHRAFLETIKAPMHDSQGTLIGVLGIGRDITDRKQAEDELKKSKKLLESVFNSSQDLILVIDKDLRVLMSNWKSPLFAGHTEFPINAHCYESFIHRDIPCEPCHALGVFNTAKGTIVEYYNQYTKLFMEVNAYPIFDENNNVIMVAEHVRNITDRKRAEEELLWKTAFLEAQTEASIDGILVVDEKNEILLKNQHLLDIWKVPQHIRDDKDDAPLLQYVSSMIKYPKQFLEKVTYLYEHQNETSRDEVEFKDGMVLDRYSSPVLGKDGKYFGRIWTFRDITEHKQTVERIRKALGATINAIAITVETRDPYTAGHQRRVADLARVIATEMNLSVDQIAGIRMAATIHDLGKISVPAEILSTPKELTNIEFSLIKTHAQAGYDILKDIKFPWPVARMVIEHHERMDGSGYPNGLAGDNLLLESRILAVADVVESMASHRPYRPSLGIEAALEEIEKNKGTLYDNTVADACMRLFREKGYHLKEV